MHLHCSQEMYVHLKKASKQFLLKNAYYFGFQLYVLFRIPTVHIISDSSVVCIYYFGFQLYILFRIPTVHIILDSSVHIISDSNCTFRIPNCTYYFGVQLYILFRIPTYILFRIPTEHIISDSNCTYYFGFQLYTFRIPTVHVSDSNCTRFGFPLYIFRILKILPTLENGRSKYCHPLPWKTEDETMYCVPPSLENNA